MYRIAENGIGEYYVQKAAKEWYDVAGPFSKLEVAKETLQNWIDGDEYLKLKDMRTPIIATIDQ